MKPVTFVEVITPCTPRGEFHYAVFDFDGTISLIREGWQQIMIPYFADELTATPKGKHRNPQEIWKLASDFVEYNTGKQTIYQCISLAEEVEKLGGTPLTPQAYKEEYHQRLLERIDGRLKRLREGSISPQEYLLPGSIQLLELLKNKGITMYLASGTDEEYVFNEADLLGVTQYFNGGIYGAQTDYKTFSKKMVIERIVRENSLAGPEVIGFGDGYVEIENIKEVGGFACGIASDEAGKKDIDPWKRQRLIKAGADIIIPHYGDLPSLEEYLFR